MKNWSLIYRDPRSPVPSPAYDLVATSVYQPAGTAEDMGLRFGGSRRFETVGLHTFARLGERLGASGADLGAVAEETVEGVLDAWSSVSHLLDSDAPMRDAISANIELRSGTLR